MTSETRLGLIPAPGFFCIWIPESFEETGNFEGNWRSPQDSNLQLRR